MKRVVAISSSGRKRNTFRLIESARSRLEKAGFELEIIHLADFKIRDCRGCDACILIDTCPLQDECGQLLKKLEEAEGIILTSPVYMAGVSGQLKRLIDRTCRWYHRPSLVGKPVLLMTTTAGGYANDVLNYMQKISIFWGMKPCGRIKRTVKNWELGVTEQEMDPFIRALSKDKRTKWHPSLDAVMTFQVQKALAHHVLPRDKEYWQEHQWTNRIYYENSQVPFYKKCLGKSLYSLLSHGMTKSKAKQKAPK